MRGPYCVRRARYNPGRHDREGHAQPSLLLTATSRTSAEKTEPARADPARARHAARAWLARFMREGTQLMGGRGRGAAEARRDAHRCRRGNTIIAALHDRHTRDTVGRAPTSWRGAGTSSQWSPGRAVGHGHTLRSHRVKDFELRDLRGHDEGTQRTDVFLVQTSQALPGLRHNTRDGG